MVGLPFVKLAALALKQISRPIVRHVVRYSKEHEHMGRLCVRLGRIVAWSNSATRKGGEVGQRNEFGNRKSFLRSVMSTLNHGSNLPHEELKQSGAEMLVELLVYFAMALILVYEMKESSASARAKDAALNARIADLEKRIEELDHRNQMQGKPTVTEPARKTVWERLAGVSVFFWKTAEDVAETVVDGEPEEAD